MANISADTVQQSLAAFDESNQMYAIPAETVSQDQPFQKENLPGPGVLCHLASSMGFTLDD